VFAIAITLLVLDLRMPAGGAVDFSHIGDKLFGFALSFWVIAAFWLSHHRLFGGLKADDAAVRVVNLGFLACIVFLPFPTSVIAEHQANADSVRFYALSVGAAGVMLEALVLTARRKALLADGQTAGGTARVALYSVVTPVVFLISIGVAGRSPQMAMQLWWLIIPGLVLSVPIGRWLERRIDGKSPAP
jgi:uncharacterized membrane protein